MNLVTLMFLLFSALINCSNAIPSVNNRRIGVNYGTIGNNLLSPYQSIELIKSMNVGNVKLYDANPETLKLLAGTDLRVSIMVPNDEIPVLAANESMADQWIVNNVLPYLPRTIIRTIMVGNEILSNYNQAQWDGLVQTMRFIRNSLKARNIHNVKIGTPLAMDVLNSSFPPSSGSFKANLLPTIVPLLYFLNSTNSFFNLDVYPYFPWSFDPVNINLDFALFRGARLTYRDPASGLLYTNLLDQMIDSVYFAMEKLGFRNIRIAISETGWPNAGDVDEPGANVYNAATYNRNLARKIMADPPIGTPARPGTVIPTFLFSLYDENLKGGPGTERHWGLHRHDGVPVYEIDLTGMNTNYKDALPVPENNEPYEGGIWCVVAREANVTALGEAMKLACSELNGECENALAPGKGCYEPVSVVWHASYAFSAHWARFRSFGAHCHFSGLAVQTTGDPSHETCRFPKVSL
ncbi:hypothetical protein V2J09_014381 [Rumex salicifolius]